MIVAAWALAFVLTCAIELVTVRWLGPSRRQVLRVVLLAQVVTHPLVWIAMELLPGSQLARLMGVELWATTIEALLYARFLRIGLGEAFTLSAAANAASLLLVAAVGALV